MAQKEDEDDIFDEKTFGDIDADQHIHTASGVEDDEAKEAEEAPFELYEEEEEFSFIKSKEEQNQDQDQAELQDSENASTMKEEPLQEDQLSMEQAATTVTDEVLEDLADEDFSSKEQITKEPVDQQEEDPSSVLPTLAAGAAAMAALGTGMAAALKDSGVKDAELQQVYPSPTLEKARLEKEERAKAIGRIPVTLGVELSKISIPASKLIELQEGSVLSLSTTITEPVTLVANGHPVARGVLVQIGEVVGVRITHIL
jgi:flagellar motor switch protein FliN/FliY